MQFPHRVHVFGWDNETLSDVFSSFLHSFGDAFIVSFAKHLASVFWLPSLTIHGRFSLVVLSLDFFDISGMGSLKPLILVCQSQQTAKPFLEAACLSVDGSRIGR